jgi:hypothetical protein
MRGALTLVLAAAAAVALLAGPGSASSTAKLTVCGQIKNGPAHDWSFPRATANQLGIPTRVKGTTWTVIVDSVACAFAMKHTRTLLAEWPKATPGRRMTSGPSGWTCAKDVGFGSAGKGSPGGSCLKPPRSLFTFLGTGPYSLAQVKQLAATGQLPG